MKTHLNSYQVVVLLLASICAMWTHAAPFPESDMLAAADAPSSTGRASAPSKLGNLNAFRDIAEDVAKLVDKGDLASAKAHIKYLEVSWDSAEAGLKPRAASEWHTLDKAIDQAIAALRSTPPKQADCKAAMTTLLATFDKLQGR